MLKKVFTSKPSVSTQIDRSHSLGKELVAAWTFAEGGGSVAINAAGNPNASLSNVVAKPGRFGMAGYFDGSTAYGQALVAGTPLSTYPAISIACLFKLTSSPGLYCRLIEKGANNEISVVFNYTGGNSKLGLQTITSTPLGCETTANMYDGNWHMAVVTVGLSNYLYVDGVYIGSAGGSIITKTGDINFGQYSPSPGTYNFPGLIDGVWIWNRVLTAGEIMRFTTSPYSMFYRRTIFDPNVAAVSTEEFAYVF